MNWYYDRPVDKFIYSHIHHLLKTFADFKTLISFVHFIFGGSIFVFCVIIYVPYYDSFVIDLYLAEIFFDADFNCISL